MRRILFFMLLMLSLQGLSQNISQLRPSDGPGHIPMTAGPYFRQVYTSPGVVADTLAKYMDQICGGNHADDTLTLYLCEVDVIVDSIKFELILAGGGGGDNLSNANLTADGNRSSDWDGYDLEISNIGSFESDASDFAWSIGANLAHTINSGRASTLYGTYTRLANSPGASSAIVDIGYDRSANGTAAIDFHTDTDEAFEFSIKAYNGGAVQFDNAGVGEMSFENSGGNISFDADGGNTTYDIVPGTGLRGFGSGGFLHELRSTSNDVINYLNSGTNDLAVTKYGSDDYEYWYTGIDHAINEDFRIYNDETMSSLALKIANADNALTIYGDIFTPNLSVLDNTIDSILVRDNATGEIKLRSASSISGGGGSSLFTDGGVTTYLTSTGDRLHIGGTGAVRKFQVTQDHDTNVGLVRIENTGDGDATFEFGAAGVYGAIGMNSSDSNIIIAHHDNVDASRAVYIDPSAKVGIGIDPSYKLDVNGSIRLRSGLYDGSGDIGTANYVLRSTGSGVDWISPDTYDNQDISWNAGARELTIDNGSTIGLTGLSLWTDGGVTSYLTSTSDRVAIGGTSASNKLHVQQHTSSNAAMIRMQNDNAFGGDATLAFQANGAFGAIGMNGSDSTIIISHHDNLDASRAVYVDQSANVGIGIDPAYKLDVNGSTRLRAALYDNSGDMGGSGQVLSSTGASATNWIDLPDGSATNEIQTLSWSSGSSELSISGLGGNTVDLSSLAGGSDGIYGGTGDVGGGTSNVVAAIASGQYLAFDYNGGTDEVYIGTNTNLYSGGAITSSATAVNQISSSTSDVQIISTTQDVTVTAGSGSGDNVLISAEGENVMTIDKDYTIVTSNMLIGDDTADQLEIQTKDADNGVYMAHEDAMDADAVKGDDSYIGLFENGNVTVSSGLDGALEASCFIYGHDILSLKADATVGRVGIEGSVVYTTVGSDFGVGGVPQTGYEFTTHGDALIKGDLDYEDDLMDVSDKRLKKNIGKIRDSYARVMALKPVHYKMKKSDKEEYGYIAQDYQEVFPEQTKERSDGMLSISYQSANTYTTAAVQELIEENEDMKKRIEKLEDIIKKLDK